MSKSLDVLKRIEHDMEYVTRLDFVEPIVRGEVQQELSKIYHREEKDLTIIEKELKAWEISKMHPFAFASLSLFLDSFGSYEEWEKTNPNCFTKEEYELLRHYVV